MAKPGAKSTRGASKAAPRRAASRPDKVTAFLVGLATDPAKLGRFIQSPDAELDAAGLDPTDRAILRGGDPGAIHARIGGQPAAPRPDQPIILVVSMDDGEQEGGPRPRVAQADWPPMVMPATPAMFMTAAAMAPMMMMMMMPYPSPMMPYPSPMMMSPVMAPMMMQPMMQPIMAGPMASAAAPQAVHPHAMGAAAPLSPPMVFAQTMMSTATPPPMVSPFQMMSPMMMTPLPMMAPMMTTPFPPTMMSPFQMMSPMMMSPVMMTPLQMMSPMMMTPFQMTAPMMVPGPAAQAAPEPPPEAA